ncbi:translation initiation factor IF-2 [Brevundimonas sp. GCM10030266]|uniref:translation initiation factor IF-2 n=1 Tax=Brevundimonas sp. GCM10030266 TaxID=3273386 RepID=UPI003613D7BC
MSIRLILAASALLVSAPAALAQEAPAAPPVAPAPVDPAEAAFQLRAQAFQTEFRTMAQEMDAVVKAGGDQARVNSDLDAIEARYQPKMQAFVDELTVFLQAQAAKETDAEEKAEMLQTIPVATQQILGLPAMIRSQIVAAAAAAAAEAPASAE